MASGSKPRVFDGARGDTGCSNGVGRAAHAGRSRRRPRTRVLIVVTAPGRTAVVAQNKEQLGAELGPPCRAGWRRQTSCSGARVDGNRTLRISDAGPRDLSLGLFLAGQFGVAVTRAACRRRVSVASWGMARRPSADFRERLVAAIDAGLPRVKRRSTFASVCARSTAGWPGIVRASRWPSDLAPAARRSCIRPATRSCGRWCWPSPMPRCPSMRRGWKPRPGFASARRT